MNNNREESTSEGGRFPIVQPHRDPESNWAVDLVTYLEEYLVKICSGDVTGEDDGALSVNFAEAALLLQGSVQVYSRKVEYLYQLVLHVLEFLSNKRQQDQTEKNSDQPEGGSSQAVIDDEDNEPFLGLDDVIVDPKNCLDGGHSKDDVLNQFVKPPANLVVLEGDCFDAIGDVGELESYLLATNDLFRDFILLDPCDAGAVQDFLNGDKVDVPNSGARRGSSFRSKNHKSVLQSPTRKSGGAGLKSPLAGEHGVNLMKSPRTPGLNHNADVNDDHIWPDPPAFDLPENDYHDHGMDDGFQEPMDGSDSDDDDDDPWKPLDPHEPGTFKVKPFKKGKIPQRQKICSTKRISLATEFPVAKMHAPLNPDIREMCEAHELHDNERLQEAQSPPLYEKLRQSLTIEANEISDVDENDENEYENDTPDFDQADFDMPDNPSMDADVPQNNEHAGDDAVHFGENAVFGQEDPECNASLEDLCRSHLDALLASIAESEKQTELATRVSTWKQGIERTLEEQDSRPPFDIHEYGERVMDKLSSGADSNNCMSFSDIVSGQEKHEVARTFSALLQLVNNRNTDLVREESSSQSVCYKAVNPFYVKLLNNHGKRRLQVQFQSTKKTRVKSPIGKHPAQGRSPTGKHVQGKRNKRIAENASPSSPSLRLTSSEKSPEANGHYSVRLGKSVAVRVSPDSKRRRPPSRL